MSEAQRTQGIESMTWIMFSNWLQSEIWFKLQTQYPGSVVPLAMFFNSELFVQLFFNFFFNFFQFFFNFFQLLILKFGRDSEIWSTFWNLAETLKFGLGSKIWSRFWNLVKILKFSRNPEIWSKSWNLVKILVHLHLI